MDIITLAGNEEQSASSAPQIEAQVCTAESKGLSVAEENLTKVSNVEEDMNAVKNLGDDNVTQNENEKTATRETIPEAAAGDYENIILGIELGAEIVEHKSTEIDEHKNEILSIEGDNIFDTNSKDISKDTNSDVKQTECINNPAASNESEMECEKESHEVEKLAHLPEKSADKPETQETEDATLLEETSNDGSAIELMDTSTETIKNPAQSTEKLTESNKTIENNLENAAKCKSTLDNATVVVEEIKSMDLDSMSLPTVSTEKAISLVEEEIEATKAFDSELQSTENDEESKLIKKIIDVPEEVSIDKLLNSTVELGNAEIDDEQQDLTKTERRNTTEIDDEQQDLTKTERRNTTTEIDDEQDLTKTDEDNTEKPSEKAIQNEDQNGEQNSDDDDVQIEKPNITIIEIDDDDDDDIMTSSNANIKESTCQETGKSEPPLENTTKQSAEPMDVDSEVGTTTTDTVVQPNTEDIEIKDTTSPAEKGQDADTNALLVTTIKTPSPTPENDEMPSMNDDISGEVYYNKECVNYECARKHKQFFRAPLFALSYYKITKKKFKPQFICAECYDQALEMYEEFSNLLAAKQPLLLKDIVAGRQEFVEIIDSSDEEDEDDKTDKSKDNKYFSKDDIKLIENELENSIRKVLEKVEIQNQLTWSKTILASRAKALEEETNYIDSELRSLQKKADHMHVTLYQCPKIKVRQLQPLDLNTGRPYATVDVEVALPPIGEIHRPPVKINDIYFAVKNKAIASWVPCKVIEQVESPSMMKNLTHYKIRFLKSQYQPYKTVSVKHLAHFDPPNVRLPIGSRVIAYFDATSLSRGKEKMMIQSAFYPGIIAEPLKPNNKYRYLIFYDDGYTQYVYHKDVRLVCNVSDNVWEDVHPGSRDFIQKYLTQYSINRPMVQTQKGQSMTTESNGKWIYARVVDIDCSLIQMQFEGPKSHTEWIYRGSMRLGPVFKEHQKAMQKTTLPISRLPRRTEPFIRYTEDEEATSTQQQQQQQQRQQQQQQQNEPRAVAKKSVSRQESTSSQFSQVPVVRHLNNSTIYLEDENKPKGKVVYYTAKRNLPPQIYKPHTCAPSCLYKITHNLSAYSPLSKPLLSGWERLIIRQKIKKVVTYRGPCGKIQRNMKELRNYLRVTNNILNVENFDFSPDTNCLAEYVIESAIVQKRDISNGQEKMAIPLVNYYDSTMPPECKYSAKRIPTEGVNLNVDEEFLVGCDCDDDCSDKTKCGCWQLTYAGAKYGNPNTPIEELGYQYKRLYEHVPTGIYECNPRCKCKSNCLNRVVQHSLEMKLQVFKTSNRGWGLRCINDVPRGSFMCVYAGHLLTEAKANEGGLDAGDEYFAELDYIEVAEQIKEGYESDVDSPEPEEEDDLYDQEENDDEFTPSKPHNTRSKARLQKSTRGSSAQGTDEDSQERQMINFNPNAIMDEHSMRESSIRTLFGKDEACYVMDAKVTGNLGRYFNHSCSPNLFVQNVFVDTHDLRFPWVAFFALTHIRAGTELTWNYNYEVGVVPGKVLYCQCGAPNCRLRLL